MTTTPFTSTFPSLTPLDEQAQERFARTLVAHLNHSQEALPYVVTERLRAAREQAVAQRKRASTPLLQHAPAAQLQTAGQTASQTAGTSGGLHDNTPVWLRRALTLLPLLALAVALVTISVQQDQRATVGVAELDAELLTSALPPDAYTDPGFLHFLQINQTAAH